MKFQDVKIIIGLGNPDKNYEKTYHNIGFLAINYLNNCQLQIADYQLLKSNVFMNQSGQFVSKIIKKNKIKPEKVLIIHDDSDIEIGNYKISFGRGSAGHNGVESVIKSLRTKDFWRLRIGIRPLKSKQKAEKFVLKKISKKDFGMLENIFKEINEKML